MALESDMRDMLKADVVLQGLMNVENIFPNWTLSSTSPYICFVRISGVSESSKERGYHRVDSTVQVEIFSGSYAEGVEIAGRVMAVFNGTEHGEHSFYVRDERDVGDEQTEVFKRSIDVAVESFPVAES